MRYSPNVIITGTPGVGKTVHCEQLAQDTGLRHLSVNQIAKDRGCFDTYDEELETWVVDEDKVRCPFLCGCNSAIPPCVCMAEKITANVIYASFYSYLKFCAISC